MRDRGFVLVVGIWKCERGNGVPKMWVGLVETLREAVRTVPRRDVEEDGRGGRGCRVGPACEASSEGK